ncbi:purine-binding chemotaxis protein CheW [Cereibacter ovatus]|uniref:Chemotaxis protein CheW n=1 Tax=Cereibacter ovatus TaxID=439529 RepID=A0A285CK95_9RHOB|nr:chemotaxis protein CheW [Cereibacter ovatus]SNX67785.1 purine-binding chemotaxis protein CheW [Cereibacter ovatus]
MAEDLTRTARAEAQALSETDNVDDMYLTFAIGGEEYGVGIGGVTEIVGMQRIMSVPDVPAYIRGVINLRGKVIPLMDVRLRFGMAERAYDERTVIIVLDVADAPVGLIVDGVSEVLDIAPSQIDRPGQFGRSTKTAVMGLARVGDRVTILLDAEVLVGDGDLALPAEMVV